MPAQLPSWPPGTSPVSTSAKQALFIGVDLGTTGVRALVTTAAGELVSRSEHRFPNAISVAADGAHEQAPAAWRTALVQTLGRLGNELGVRRCDLVAVAVDGTSGTVVPVDRDGAILRPALMYNDPRARQEADELTARAAPWCTERGYRIEASFAAARIRWIRLHEPSIFEKTRWFVHQADFATAFLTGQYGTTDFNNALKTGYDLQEETWPPWLCAEEGVAERLPEVVSPGEVVGRICPEAAAACELPSGLTVVAGTTDGTAGFLASGATKPGDDNTSLGTTLIFKRLAQEPAVDTSGRVYSHKLPAGLWAPGAASNTGSAWVQALFPQAHPPAWDKRAAALLPSPHLVYPLVGKGERFPFVSQTAVGFGAPDTHDPLAHFAACLQGTALVERCGYEVLDRVAGKSHSAIFSTGAASRSDVWLQLRADVAGRCIHRPLHPEAAFGSAVLAASRSHFDSVWDAAAAMVRIEQRFEPDLSRREVYDERHLEFTRLLAEVGYLGAQ
jgi:sugar (pentulose or hexulose) kinase